MSLQTAWLDVEHPESVLTWLTRSQVPALIEDLVRHTEPITHALLDDLPPDRNTRYLRELLVATQVLPARNEVLARNHAWAARALAEVPARHLAVIRPFVEWGVLRQARRTAARGRYTTGAGTCDRKDIRTAIELLAWLERRGRELDHLTHDDVEQWLHEGTPIRRRATAVFLRWTGQRRLTPVISIPLPRTGLPSKFLSEQDQQDQLRRCLHDDALPLALRIAGALINLYALNLTVVLDLTVDRYQRIDEGDGYLTLAEHPVLLPPALARLIELQIAAPARTSLLHQRLERAYLFPGQPPSRPRSSASIGAALRKHGIAPLATRNTAMLTNVSELPAVVISDLFGLHVKTANRWVGYANDSWAQYLAARAGASGKFIAEPGAGEQLRGSR